MNRVYPAILVFIGFLVVFLPHFGLPMDYYRTITMAYDKPVPRWWTHPELYMGSLIFLSGLITLLAKTPPVKARLLELSAALGLLVALQGVFLFSFSGWMLWIPDYERSYHSAVVKLHRGITPVLITLGLTASLTALLGRIRSARRREGVRGRLTYFHVAGANLFRRPFRTVAVMSISALAAGMTFFGSFVLLATLTSGSLSVSRFGADIIVVPKGYEPSTRDVILGGEPVEFVMPESVLDEVREVEGVSAASPQLYIRALPYRGCCAVQDMLIVAIDPKTDFTVKPWMDYTLREGVGPDDVILGYHVMFAPGQRIQLFDRYVRVAGMLSPTGMEFFDSGAFITMGFAHELAAAFPAGTGKGMDFPPKSISTVLVRLMPGADLDGSVKRISDKVKGVDVIPVKSLLPPAKLWLLGSVNQLWPLLALVWALCCTFLLLAFFMIFNERLREVGLLRALGAKKGWVLRMFLAEAGFIVGIGSVIGVSCGWLATIAYRRELVEGAVVNYQLPGLWESGLLFLACILMGLAAGLASAIFPAYRASGAEPYNAIRKGE